jgi:hypothetical protein
MGKRREGDRQFTEWLRGDEVTPSGLAEGGELSNRDWCDLERARLAGKGCRVEVRENKRHPGWFALFRV